MILEFGLGLRHGRLLVRIRPPAADALSAERAIGGSGVARGRLRNGQTALDAAEREDL